MSTLNSGTVPGLEWHGAENRARFAAVMDRAVKRLARGHETYGPFDPATDRREAEGEILDCIVYAYFGILALRPRRGEKLATGPLSDRAPERSPMPGWSEDEWERRLRVRDGKSVLANVGKGKDENIVGWAKRTGRLVYIGGLCRWRPDLVGPYPWANPYRIGRDGNRDAVCDLYAQHLANSPALLARLPELRGKVLACWCAPLRCHGEEILKALEGARP